MPELLGRFGRVQNGYVTKPAHGIHYTPVTLVRNPSIQWIDSGRCCSVACSMKLESSVAIPASPRSTSTFSLLGQFFVQEFRKFSNLGPDTPRHKVCYMDPR